MVRRGLLVKRLAELGLPHGCILQAIVQMYGDAPPVPKNRTVLGLEIGSQCGVKQGDPLSPLLFGLFIDELEQWLQKRLPGAGVPLGPHVLHILLYADDLVLVAPNPQLLRFRLIMMIIILMRLAWCMRHMQPSLAPSRAPPLWGPFVICNL